MLFTVLLSHSFFPNYKDSRSIWTEIPITLKQFQVWGLEPIKPGLELRRHHLLPWPSEDLMRTMDTFSGAQSVHVWNGGNHSSELGSVKNWNPVHKLTNTVPSSSFCISSFSCFVSNQCLDYQVSKPKSFLGVLYERCVISLLSFLRREPIWKVKNNFFY